MSDAGVVNTDGREANKAFDGILSAASPEVRGLAHAVRDLVYDVYPDTVEVIWPRQGSVGWGVGPKKMSEQFCYLLTFAKHVTLGFYYGGELKDPAALLGSGGKQGSGKLSMRSLKIATLQDVERPELRGLVESAVDHLSQSDR